MCPASQIKNALDAGDWVNDNAVDKMLDGIQEYDSASGTSYLARWTSLDDTNGINHPQP
jgi:hypothetical protein